MRFSVVLMLGAFAACPGCVGAGETEDGASDGTSAAAGSARVEHVGTEAAACAAWGPTPHGVVAENATLAVGECVGTEAAACAAWGPPPHGIVMDDTALAPDAVPQ